MSGNVRTAEPTGKMVFTAIERTGEVVDKAKIQSMIRIRVSSGKLEVGQVLDIGGIKTTIAVIADHTDLLMEDSRQLEAICCDFPADRCAKIAPNRKDAPPSMKRHEILGAKVTLWNDVGRHEKNAPSKGPNDVH